MSFFRRKPTPSSEESDATRAGETPRRSAGAPDFSWDMDDDFIDLQAGAHAAARADARADAEAASRRDEERPALERQPAGDSHLADAFRSPQADGRAAAVRRNLDRALDRWWATGELPPLPLLRDGLLLLAADRPLDEPHRTLLLRAALHHRRGIVTALSFQLDPERTALLLTEALLDPAAPLPPEMLRHLVQEDEKSALWLPLLRRELADAAVATLEPARRRAAAALAALEGRTPPPVRSARPGPREPERRLTPFRVALLALLLGALLFLFWWRDRAPDFATVELPAGEYTIGGPNNPQTFMLDSVWLDRNEVTVGQYRRCYERGGCPWPGSPASATRPEYFISSDYDAFPVVNIDQSAAAAYCAWLGKRLPSAEEWEVAATDAPATRRSFAYPWGDEFQPRLTNSLASGVGDSQPVGVYSPGGDSPLGLADMAGNVAEWTATVDPARPDAYITKGGSFDDGPEQLLGAARLSVDGSAYSSWLGFRCANVPSALFDGLR